MFFNVKIFNAKTQRREGRKDFMSENNLVYSSFRAKRSVDPESSFSSSASLLDFGFRRNGGKGSHPCFSLRSSRLRVFAFDVISTEAG